MSLLPLSRYRPVTPSGGVLSLFIRPAFGASLLVPFLISPLAQAAASPTVSHAARSASHHARPKPLPPRPNIVLIVLDTVRSDALGPSPRHASDTPFLDTWKQHALNFHDALSPDDMTGGSHAAMLTGYPPGILGSSIDLPTTSLVFDLNQLGYDTIGISANPNVDPSVMASVQPFQTFVSSPWLATPVFPQSALTLLRYYEGPSYGPAELIEYSVGKLVSSASYVNQALSATLAHCTFLTTSSRPLFLFLNFTDAHDPYFPPPPFSPSDTELQQRWPANGDLSGFSLQRPRDAPVSGVRAWQYAASYSPGQLQFLRRLYQGNVRFLDGQLRQTFAILEKAGLLKNTVVVVTSDHGEAFGESGYIGHGLWAEYGIYLENLFRVPLLIRGYGVRLKRTQQPAPSRTLRLAESIRAWAGVPPARHFYDHVPTRDTLATIVDDAAATLTERAPPQPGRRIEGATEPPLPKSRRTAEEIDRDQERIRRLRSLGYIH